MLEHDCMMVATTDQENCLSYIATPEWMWPWFCCPALPHWAFGGPEVTGRPDLPLNARLHPAYKRLPMGCSHSVDLVIAINNHAVGASLVRSHHLHESAVLKAGPVQMQHQTKTGRVCWELFAGSAGWTNALVALGWGALTPIDHEHD